ncbi:acyltransferase family protein [Clostridium sp. AM58-1XD]|uniref:acyltransferase family protein n=1 Tax=Clostridium sp. AM58-1XD TaxID=2292307 RepID=UPI000E4C396D|nr:acyltransferase family protein [Clostridium sp. AM58-1XD]RGY96568.1 acyltransferase [Clostridium sp. AM58-1XD]
MEEGRFRNKIYWFTFLFSVLVVWVHSANAEIYLGWTDEAYLLYAFENFIGNVVAQVAVPGFFMISSYLFYRNFSWDKLKIKWYSRIRTVLVPFIVWNFLYYMGYVIASRITGLKDVVGKGIVPFNLMAAGDAILNYTYNYVFWYLYQLILLILLAPFIYLVIRNRYTAAAAGIAVLLAINCGYRLMYLNLDALLYYGIAAYFAVHGKRAAEGEWSGRRMAVGAVMAAAGVTSLMLSAGGVRVVFVVMFRLLIPLSLWLMVSEKKLLKARGWMKNNFFLYAVHFAFVRLINKTGAAVLPHVIEVPLTLYLLMPIICIVISSLLSAAIKKISPPVWTLLTGGRTA